MTKEKIAQWVIDNRYPKSENNKISDSEMYNTLIERIEEAINYTHCCSKLIDRDKLTIEEIEEDCRNIPN